MEGIYDGLRGDDNVPCGGRPFTTATLVLLSNGRQSDLGTAARCRRHQDQLRMVIRLGCSRIVVRLRAGWR